MVTAAFPESNAFGRMSYTPSVVCRHAYLALPDIVNGEQNKLAVSIENKSDRNVTLKSISGSFHHPETNALIKNVRCVAYVPSLKLIVCPGLGFNLAIWHSVA